MGFTGKEAPFFFLKPADALLAVPSGTIGEMPYPTLTQNLHYECELVVAINKGGKNISVEDAYKHIFGYCVGLDMTRRDLQTDCKKQSRPWSIGKGFDYSAPMGEITPATDELTATVTTKELWLQVNGETKQKTTNDLMISSVPEVIHHISQAWEL